MSKRIFYGSPNPDMKFMWANERIATLYTIANTLFMLEKLIKLEKTPRKIIIDYFFEISKEVLKRISQLLNFLVLDVLCEDVKFIFEKKELQKEDFFPKFPKCKNVCLFSGGLDSTIGILKSKKQYKDVLGLYVAHQDTPRITSIVNNIKESHLKRKAIKIIKLIAPKMGKDYAQLRGFLYILYGEIFAYLCGAERIIISECGATMYQPKFAPLDTITYTTHPYVLQISREISEKILDKKIELVIPFENFTKSEVIGLIPDDDLLSKTHSCLTSMWGENCGKCYGCITRMIGSVNNGLSLHYFRGDAFATQNKILGSLLNFCLNFRLNKEEIDFWSFKNIEYFDKEELFNKVCRDVFLCLKILYDKGNLDSNYTFILEEYLENFKDDTILRKEELERIRCIPNFDKKVGNYRF